VQPIAPPMLDLIVRTCLEKDPDARFQSTRDVVLATWLMPILFQTARERSGSNLRSSESTLLMDEST
jgi:hypothetical protein